VIGLPDALNIDRIAPTRQPMGRTVMRQQWRNLLFLHWTVPVEQLRPLIPAELAIDTYEGQAYIGLVPFTMRNVRPTWSPPVPPLSHFHEINVRTYVHRQGRSPGVWFFSLDAANAIAVKIARLWFKLPYFYARMNMSKQNENRVEPGQAKIRNPTSNIRIDYTTERLWPAPTPAGCHVQWTPEGDVHHAQPCTLEHFLVERYILYSGSNGQLYSGQVHHPPYPVQTATVHHLEENLIAQAGILRPDTPPALIHYAGGVDVQIYPLKRIP
jgi:uncharacterized protein YqjF (DUF2071 family)